MKSIRLSVCIPTYNFGEFLGETLESVIRQITEGVEIVVLDGGSSDGTEPLVRDLQNNCPQLKYYRLPERGGIDRDMARTVDLANGEYCWLFGGDDLMRQGALREMLNEIELGCDVYLCGLTLCTLDMRPIVQHRILNIPADAEFQLGDSEERLDYFLKAETTTAFFSFLGSIVVNKARWDTIGLDEAFVGSLWAHVVRILRMIPGGLRLKYLSKSYLYKRSGNDSFMDSGIVNRYRVAIEGYHRVASVLFGDDSTEALHMRRVIRNEFPPQYFFEAQLDCKKNGRHEDIRLLDRLAALTYKDRSLRNRIYFLGYKCTPLWMYLTLRFIHRRLRSLLNERQA